MRFGRNPENEHFPGIGEFEVNILNMKVGMVNGYKFAPNRISLASKVSKGQRPEYQNSCLVNKIKSMPSWPGSKILYKNVIYQ